MKVGFVGCSHLGICSAVAAAEKNFDVICFDFNKNLIKNLNEGIINFFEPKLKTIIKKNKKKILFSSNIKDLNLCKIIFISQDTSTNKKNKSNFSSLKKLINKVINKINKNITLVIMSQAYPGFTETINWNKNKLFYLVETLIFGKAIKRALKPEQMIIGCEIKNNKFKKNYFLEKYVNKFTKNINYMHYKNAELAKISINLYLISSITFTNMLSEYCEKVKINWTDTERILRNDKRIGKSSYLSSSLGITSGNLLRDLNNAKTFLKKSNCDYKLVEIWEKKSKERKNWLINLINKKSKINDRIGIFGIPYKENTTTLKNSITIEIIKKYKSKNFNIYDPKIKLNFSQKNFSQLRSYRELIKKSDILIFITPWDFIKKFSNQNLLCEFSGKYILDPFNIIHNKIIKKNNLIKFSCGIGDFSI